MGQLSGLLRNAEVCREVSGHIVARVINSEGFFEGARSQFRQQVRVIRVGAADCYMDLLTHMQLCLYLISPMISTCEVCMDEN